MNGKMPPMIPNKISFSINEIYFIHNLCDYLDVREMNGTDVIVHRRVNECNERVVGKKKCPYPCMPSGNH